MVLQIGGDIMTEGIHNIDDYRTDSEILKAVDEILAELDKIEGK